MPQGRHGITAETPKRIFIDAGAVYFNYGLQDERLLGATRGGNVFDPQRSLREMEVDGALGRVMGMVRREEVLPIITANMLELTVDNLLKSIAGATQEETPVTEVVDAELVGMGDDTQTIFTLANSPVVENSERVYVNGVLQSHNGDYTIDYQAGEIEFSAAPADGDPITASYVYETGDPAEYDTITGGPIIHTEEESVYIPNVALIGTISGKEDPIIAIVKNAIADTGLDLDTAHRDETVPEITFMGHFDAAAPHDEPWELRFPRG